MEVTTHCAYCGKETSNPRFCSRSCAATLTNKEVTKNHLVYDWAEMQRLHRRGMKLTVLYKQFRVSFRKLKKAVSEGLFVKIRQKRQQTDAVRKILSDKQKKWLKENPERHPWRRKDKFQSVPCNHLKNILRELGLSFLEEYIPLIGRFYSIDIAFPDKKIGIEVNGGQHYDSNGKLKDYYQIRHDNIEREGWNLIELHHSVVYNKDIVSRLIEDLMVRSGLGAVDYSYYEKRQDEIRNMRLEKRQRKPMWFCRQCGKGLAAEAKTGLCMPCLAERNRKVFRPSKEQLAEDISSLSWLAMGRKYGVSDNAVRKWARRYGILGE